MAERVWLDYESFSELPLKDVGASKYAEDESTMPICIGYAIDNQPVKIWIDSTYLTLPPMFVELSECDIVYQAEMPDDLKEALESGAAVIAHNAEFDLCVHNEFYDEIPVEQWRDAMALAAFFALPLSLDGATSARRQKHKKDKRGKYLINMLCKPKKPTKKDPSVRRYPDTFPQLFEDLFVYCAADVEAMRELVMNLPLTELPEFLQEVWVLTVKGNLRGLPIDANEARKMKTLIDEYEASCLKELAELTDGEVVKAGATKKIKAWCEKHGVVLPNLQKKTIEDLLKEGGLPKKVERLFRIRQQVGRVSTKKFGSAVNRVCRDGTIKNNTVFWGAGPGRYAGRGWQVQNQPRLSAIKPEDVNENQERFDDAFDHAWSVVDRGIEEVELVYDDFMTTASGMVRSLIKAPDGMRFMSGDYSSIENRLTLWCAGEGDGLEKFRKGMDQYKDFASEHHGVPYDKVTYQQRVDAKAIVLGCGFGMGWERFMETCEEKGNPISPEKAKEGVRAFREIYPGVPAFWYGCADAAKDAIRRPGIVSKYRSEFMRLAFICEGGWLKMRLPSGRFIRYYQPRLEMLPAPWDSSQKLETITHMGYQKIWRRLKLIPGRIAENAVQGIGLDMMIAGMMRAEQANYPVLTTIHDEVLSLVRAGFGSVEEYCRIICPEFPWAREFPLVAEGWTGRRYRK